MVVSCPILLVNKDMSGMVTLDAAVCKSSGDTTNPWRHCVVVGKVPVGARWDALL
jgi:hypothetical protein